VVQLLLEAGAAVDALDFNGNTPLQLAAERGHEAGGAAAAQGGRHGKALGIIP